MIDDASHLDVKDGVINTKCHAKQQLSRLVLLVLHECKNLRRFLDKIDGMNMQKCYSVNANCFFRNIFSARKIDLCIL